MTRFLAPCGHTCLAVVVSGTLWGLFTVTSFLLAPQQLMGSSLPEPYTDTRPMLHTLVEIKAYGENLESAVNSAFNEIDRINRLLNNYDPRSEVSLINNAAGFNEVPVSPETLEALILEHIK